MVEHTAEWFARRAFDLDLVTERELDSAWAELGTRDASCRDFRKLLLRRELLTNYQAERILSGLRTGFFYGDYKVLYLVGAGSFARVFRAVHRESGKIVVVKVLRTRHRDDPVQRDQFLREGQIGMSLRHPNIVPTFEVHSDSPPYFLVLDFIEGRSLREFAKIRKKLSPLEATRLIADVLLGLDHALKRGLCHRDLKLTNVLVSSKGRAMLLDFGLAGGPADADDRPDLPNPRTIDYGTLERATGAGKNDPRSDLYFAGCMYYQLLTGEPPMVETRDKMIRSSVNRFKEIRPIIEVEPTLPHPVVALVKKAMEFDPNLRYQTPAEMLHDLHLLADRLEKAERGEVDINADTTIGGAGRVAVTRTVMIVESDAATQDVLRSRLKKHGYRVLMIGNPDLAMSRVQEAKGVADVVVFSTQEIGRAALDAFNQLGRLPTTKKIPAILLLGEAHGDSTDDAELADHRLLLNMPIRLKQLRLALNQLLAG